MKRPERLHPREAFSLPRLIKGAWQLSEGHSAVSLASAVSDMRSFVEAGVDAFDCGDVYIGVEELIGRFLDEYRRQAGAAEVTVLTKYIPDRDRLPVLRRTDVEAAVDRSIARLRVERLNVLQFHWWDLDVPRYLDVLHWLEELRRAGKIEHLGLVNFDSVRLREILDAGFRPATMQAQYSLLDRRVEQGVAQLCADHGLALLCYGTVAGGFLSDRWLGMAEPGSPPENRSLTKYKLIIDEFGGWDIFQLLLRTLRSIADAHGVDIATVAMRFIIERAPFTAIIIGARSDAHLSRNLETFSFELTEADRAKIDAVLASARRVPGDFYDLERIVDGPHGRIMKQNLDLEHGNV
ncbi:aldo/keto reductase [Rhizorhabdus wittichii DC-6]|nr:aldo/keto reductase [Rhizorhabdus wittichii DC-6]